MDVYSCIFFFFFAVYYYYYYYLGTEVRKCYNLHPQKKEEDKFQVKYLRYNILKFSIKSKHLFVLINKIQTILSLSLISKNN